jgi:nucleotide-binding universal stress UspA family protein
MLEPEPGGGSIVGTGVVVGFDGSEHANIAVDWAASEAVSRGVALTLAAATTVPLEGMRFGGRRDRRSARAAAGGHAGARR